MVSPWIIYVCKEKGSETLPVAASPFWEPQWFTRAPLCTSNKGIEARFSDGVFHCYMAHVQAIGKTYWESTQGRYIIYSIHSSSFIKVALMLGDFEAFWGDFRQISSTSGLKWPKVLRSWAVRDYYSKEYWSCSKSCHARTNITNVLSIAPYIERTAGADDLIIVIVTITYYYYCSVITILTSSTAQGGGGSFKNRKRIGEIDCCEWRMSKQKHWPTD